MRGLSPPPPPAAPAREPGRDRVEPGALAGNEADEPEPVVGKVTHRFAVVSLERMQLRELGRLLRR